MKQINPKSWHYKVYVFMSQWNAAWCHESNYEMYPNDGKMIGLCPYMRMIFIWGPMAILSNLIPFGALFIVFFAAPFKAAGFVGIAWLFGTIMTIVLAIVAFGFLYDVRIARKDAKESALLKLRQDWDEEKPETFMSLLRDWLKSYKTKICPVLEMPDDK